MEEDTTGPVHRRVYYFHGFDPATTARYRRIFEAASERLGVEVRDLPGAEGWVAVRDGAVTEVRHCRYEDLVRAWQGGPLWKRVARGLLTLVLYARDGALGRIARLGPRNLALCLSPVLFLLAAVIVPVASFYAAFPEPKGLAAGAVAAAAVVVIGFPMLYLHLVMDLFAYMRVLARGAGPVWHAFRDRVRVMAGMVRPDGAAEILVVGHSLGGITAIHALDELLPKWPGGRRDRPADAGVHARDGDGAGGCRAGPAGRGDRADHGGRTGVLGRCQLAARRLLPAIAGSPVPGWRTGGVDEPAGDLGKAGAVAAHSGRPAHGVRGDAPAHGLSAGAATGIGLRLRRHGDGGPEFEGAFRGARQFAEGADVARVSARKKGTPGARKGARGKSGGKARPRKRPGLLWRLLRWPVRIGFALLAFVVLWVLIYRFVDPPGGIYMASEWRRLGSIERTWRGMEEISPRLARAAMAGEDARFCEHFGFDFEAIQAALEANERGGRTYGASTITQQVAKNVFLWHERSWLRKGLEAGFTILIEAMWSKRRIMEVYLNTAEFAEGVFGAEAAAQHHFGRAAVALTPTQAARLAAVLPAPKNRSAGNPSSGVRRRAGRIADGARTLEVSGRADCLNG